ncbi:hypothetical protein [Tenacibaculum holothuriorum]|nr:hypothetical protein [Tenacibaculum holothuriorum]
MNTIYEYIVFGTLIVLVMILIIIDKKKSDDIDFVDDLYDNEDDDFFDFD